MKKLLNQEIYLLIPRLIDAYKEGQRIYVFLYKNRSAMLQIYDFENGVDFKKYEYTLIPLWGGSVMNFGIYLMAVYKKIIGKTGFISVGLGRQVGGVSKGVFLKIEDKGVYELVFKDTEKTKKLISEISSFENEKYLSEEVREKLIENKFLEKENQYLYLGHLEQGYKTYYLFYKDNIDPFQIKVIKYDSFSYEWIIGGYTENKLLNDVDKNKWGIK